MKNAKFRFLLMTFLTGISFFLVSFAPARVASPSVKSFLDAYCLPNDQVCFAELVTDPTVQTVDFQLTDLLNRVLESKTVPLTDGMGSVQFSTKSINSRFALVRCKVGEEWLRKKVTLRD